jgi:hypothetical protein|tara:strand:- start:512 stop:715 length:204 start_codon:yes stop_codon:yes gene_type:complete
MKGSTMIYGKISWADIIEDYDVVDSNNIIEDIYKIIDLEIDKEYIKSDEIDIYNNAKDSEYKNMIFD